MALYGRNVFKSHVNQQILGLGCWLDCDFAKISLEVFALYFAVFIYGSIFFLIYGVEYICGNDFIVCYHKHSLEI